MKRHIDIKGGHNIRDLGGYPTKDGFTIEWRKIFRAGKLSKIESTDLNQLQPLNIQTICDFRTTAEQRAAPDKWYNLENINQISLAIGEGRLDKPNWLKKVMAYKDAEKGYLYYANRSYVLQSSAQFKAFFKVLLDETNYPLLYHCTAGKDRTGFATVLLLTALGIDKETIIQDYLLTNRYMLNFGHEEIEAAMKEFELNKPTLAALFLAKEAYLQGAFDAIEEEYETIQNYLKVALEIGEEEIQTLKNILLSK